MRGLRVLLALAVAGVSRCDEYGLVFSTLLGSSPTQLEQWPGPPRQEFHAFEISRLMQSAAGDYYLLGTTTTGRLPWTGGVEHPSPYCGTYMTPAICRSIFLARVSADGSRLLAATVIPGGTTQTSAAAGLAVDEEGNAFVLEAARSVVGGIGVSRVLRITPAGTVTTLAQTTWVLGTALVRDERGNFLVAGQHQTFSPAQRGYLAVFDARGKKFGELTDLPWVPEVASFSPGGEIYVAGGSFLRKYTPLLGEEVAKTPIPAGVRAIRFGANGAVLVAGSDGRRGFVVTWNHSLVRLREAKEFAACSGAMSFGPDGRLYFASSVGGCPPIAPTPGGFQPCRGLGGELNEPDVVLWIVEPDFKEPVYVTYLGGGEGDFAGAILPHPDGSFTVAGSTWSANFPATGRADRETPSRGMSLFLSRIHPRTGPLLSTRCIANAASLVPGPIVPGAIYSIFGAGVAADEVRFDGLAAEILYSSREQINVRIPDTVSSASRVELAAGGRSAGVVEIPAARAQPGIFTTNWMGTGPAVATNADGTLNSAKNPARLGSPVTLYANGVPNSKEPLEVFLYWPEPAELIRVERQPNGVVAIQARLPRRVDPAAMGVRICVARACSRPIDPNPQEWWKKLAPRGVSLYLDMRIPSP